MRDKRSRVAGAIAGGKDPSHGGRRLHSIFEHAPISLWEQDISELRAAIGALRSRGVDMRRHLEEHPEFLEEAARLIKVVDVNEATLALYEVADRAALLGPLGRTLDLGDALTRTSLRNDVLVIAEGGTRVERESRAITPSGRKLDILIKESIPGPDEEYPYVLVSVQDITRQKRAEEELRHSEERYHSLVDNLGEGIAIVDPGENFLYANPAAETVFGVERGGLNGRNLRQFVSEGEFQRVRAETTRRRRGETSRFEQQIIRPDGALRWIELIATPQFGQGGEFSHTLGIFRDITDDRRSQAALKENEARFRTLIEQAPVSIMVSRGRASLFANRKCLQLLGMRSVEESVGRSIVSYFAPSVREEIEERTRRRSQGLPVPAEFESCVCRADGSLCPVHVAVAQVSLSDGPANIAFVTDITERTQAAVELKASEERFRKLFEESPLGIAFLDAQRNITLTNQRYRDFLGLSEEEIQMKGPAGVLHPDDRGPSLTLSEKLRAGEIPLFHLEQRYIRGDGSVVWADTHITALRDADGSVVTTIGWVHDITERKRAEAEKVKLEDQLRQAQKMESVGRLAGGVAHDFNNMLGVILGHAEMALEQVPATDPLRDSLKEIRSAAEHSAGLTRQLLSFARKQAISPRVLDLNTAVGGTIKMLQRMIGEDITIDWQPMTGPCLVEVDPSQVDQVLANLCVNARDAIPGTGRITIETRHVALTADFCAVHPGFVPAEYVLLAVGDNGCGMDEVILSHIFEPFFTTKGAGKGTGLGLATVFGIVKQNHGFINVESEPGRGTTFSIYLPRCTGEIAPPGTRDPAVQPSNCQGTILIVEDDPSTLKLATMMIRRQGYRVLAAGSAEEAVRLGREHAEISLLLTDVIMPLTNGRELAQRLRSSRPHLKVLFMSGYTADIIAHHGVLEKGEFFIQKPFSANGLADKIRETLERG